MMNMKNKPVVIGIDHGYGNMKTAHCCFRTGIMPIDGNEPVFSSDILTYGSKSYVIGQGHKEFTADKMLDQDYYLLTLAAIARELHIRNLTTARVVLAVGLPLTWVSAQKESFRAYLMQHTSCSMKPPTSLSARQHIMWSSPAARCSPRASLLWLLSCVISPASICSATSATAP